MGASRVTAANKKMAKSFKEADTFQGRFRVSTSNTRRMLGALRNQILIVVFAFAGLFRTLEGFIKSTELMETFGVRLKVLLGSVEKSNVLFKELGEYAAKVPFEFKEIMESGTMLAGVLRGGSKEIMQWMPLIGDLAAAVGMNINLATGQVMRMLSAGAAAADTFREKGVTAMLGFQYGVQYTAEETKKMLMKAWTDADSKFRGATEELKVTFKGVVSMMKDAWFNMSAGIGDILVPRLIVLIDRLKEVYKGVQEWVKVNEYYIETRLDYYIDQASSALRTFWFVVSSVLSPFLIFVKTFPNLITSLIKLKLLLIVLNKLIKTQLLMNLVLGIRYLKAFGLEALTLITIFKAFNPVLFAVTTILGAAIFAMERSRRKTLELKDAAEELTQAYIRQAEIFDTKILETVRKRSEAFVELQESLKGLEKGMRPRGVMGAVIGPALGKDVPMVKRMMEDLKKLTRPEEFTKEAGKWLTVMRALEWQYPKIAKAMSGPLERLIKYNKEIEEYNKKTKETNKIDEIAIEIDEKQRKSLDIIIMKMKDQIELLRARTLWEKENIKAAIEMRSLRTQIMALDKIDDKDKEAALRVLEELTRLKATNLKVEEKTADRLSGIAKEWRGKRRIGGMVGGAFGARLRLEEFEDYRKAILKEYEGDKNVEVELERRAMELKVRIWEEELKIRSGLQATLAKTHKRMIGFMEANSQTFFDAEVRRRIKFKNVAAALIFEELKAYIQAQIVKIKAREVWSNVQGLSGLAAALGWTGVGMVAAVGVGYMASRAAANLAIPAADEEETAIAGGKQRQYGATTMLNPMNISIAPSINISSQGSIYVSNGGVGVLEKEMAELCVTAIEQSIRSGEIDLTRIPQR